MVGCCRVQSRTFKTELRPSKPRYDLQNRETILKTEKRFSKPAYDLQNGDTTFKTLDMTFENRDTTFKTGIRPPKRKYDLQNRDMTFETEIRPSKSPYDLQKRSTSFKRKTLVNIRHNGQLHSSRIVRRAGTGVCLSNGGSCSSHKLIKGW